MKTMTKRHLAALLCFCMLLGIAPLQTFATDGDLQDSTVEASASTDPVEDIEADATEPVADTTATTVTDATTTISYTYGSSNNNAATATITVHFVDTSGSALTGATITYDSLPSYTTRNTTVTLSQLAAYFSVVVDGTTYSHKIGYTKIATSSSTAYSDATTASYFTYGASGRNYYWRYSTNGSSYSNLSSAITDIYLAYGDPSQLTWDRDDTAVNTGTADHIDIEVDTTATIVIDGVTYTASITLTRADFYGNATVIARWNGQTFTDFTYDSTDLTTSTGSDNSAQYRVGGSYPVGTIDLPVEYQFTLRKTVTFTSADNTSTFDVTMDFVSEWFSYWMESNNCPGLDRSQTAWKNGSFISGSGLDFALSASAEAVTIIVNKYIVDENGNYLTVDTAVTYDFDIYDDVDEDMLIDTTTGDGIVNSDTFTVAAGSYSDSYSTQVDPGYYCVIEDTSSLAGTTIKVGGKEYTYSRTYTISEGLLESSKTHGSKQTENGQTGILQADATDTPVFNIYNVYVDTSTTSVCVTKVWEDNGDTYGLRPTSIYVQLYQDDSPYGEPVELTADSWSYTWTELETGHTYTVGELAVSGYSSAITGDAETGFTITNTLDTGSLTLKKVVNADSSVDTSGMSFTFIIAVPNGMADGTILYDSEGNAYSVLDGKISVSVPAGGSVTLVDLPAGSYYVSETGDSNGLTSTITANGHTWTVSGEGAVSVENGGTATATITNTIADVVSVVVSKLWDDNGDSKGKRPTMAEFTVTLSGSDGSTYTISGGSWNEVTGGVYWNCTTTLPAYDSDGNAITYTITETSLTAYGYTLDYIYVGKSQSDYDSGTYITYTSGASATITPAVGERWIILGNSLDTADISIKKTVLGPDNTAATDNDDDFRFVLYASDKTTVVGTVTLTMTNDNLAHTFSNLPLGTYYLEEQLISGNSHGYTVTLKVNGQTVTPDANGLYEIVLDTKDATVSVVITNTETPLTYTITNVITGTKTLANGDDLADDMIFYFYVTDENDQVVTTGTATVSSSNYENVAITFDPATITYDHAGTYYYVIRESSLSAGGVVYDSARYDLTVVVEVNANGALEVTSTTLTKVTTDSSGETIETAADSADFTNTYNVGSTSLTLRAQKTFAGTLRANQFAVVIQEYTDDTFTVAGSYSATSENGIAGYFGATITYDDNGTYYYTVSEQPGTESGVSYDDTVYYITVTVETVNNARTVTSVTYYTNKDATVQSLMTTENGVVVLADLSFTNGYTASGSAEISVIKVMQGRKFVVGETFTFLITPEDPNSPALTDPQLEGVTFVANSDGTYTVTVTASSTGAQSADGSSYDLSWVLGVLALDESHIGGTYIYRVSETDASITNGMTMDVATYGHLIYVTVSDAGSGVVTASVWSTNDTDWNGDGTTDDTKSVIVNTYSVGNTSVTGTKTWIDGGLTHDNETEVKLTLYRTINVNTTNRTAEQILEATDEWYPVTTDVNGDSIVFVWSGSTWTVLNLPEYDASGNPYLYTVIESTISGYTTVYTDYAGSDSNYFGTAITNTITQAYITLTGTKTWIDGGLAHDNGAEITLIVTRTSTSTGTVTLTEGTDYVVEWAGDSYTIDSPARNGLPQYDAQGYPYTYTVTEATDSDGTITVNGYVYDVSYGEDGEIINTRQSEEPTTEKEVNVGSGTEVSVDEELVYTITYYNGYNTPSTVTITDVLDAGVDYVSCTAGGVYDAQTHTVTWTIEDVEPFASGSVSVTVMVNEYAKIAGDGLSSDWDDAATVDNQATVTIGDNTIDTNIVTNPLTDDDPVDPVKTIVSVQEPQYDDSGEIIGYVSKTETDGSNIYVSVGDHVTYSITTTNHTATTQTIYIVDALDEGVDFVSASVGSYYTDTAMTVGGIDVPAHSVVWTLTVYPFSSATATLTVAVNEKAKEAAQTYAAVDPDDPESAYDAFIYDGIASIANQAAVYIGGEPSYTDVVENPLKPEEPEDPVKTVDVGDGEGVKVGDLLTYTISYYNHNNTAATVTITDALDAGVTFLSASDGGTHDDALHTVTWVLADVAPLTGGTVTVQVQVNADAKIADSDGDASVQNTASVQIGNDSAVDTNPVENPIDPDDPGTPEKVVSADSEAGQGGSAVKVGDKITYTISYYNHNSTAATVTITDVLEAGLTFDSASDSGAYDDATRTVTWTLANIPAFTTGTVTITVVVNENALGKTVTNDASVQIGDDPAVDTDPVENPVDDDPEDPVKTVDVGDGTEVSVGQEITYTISYYNHHATEALITITDQLDPGVEFVSATDQNGNTLTASDVFDSDEDTYVKWPVFTAAAYESGSVTLTVRVTEKAKEADDTGDASVENTAAVKVGNNGAVDTNPVENPLTPDDPEDPVKTVDVGAGTGIKVGDTLVYTIAYTNNLGTAAAVVITDALDEGVDYVSSSDGGVYDEATHTVTWTIENVAAFTSGSVTLTVTVNEKAKIADSDGDASVENSASVVVGNQSEQKTEPVENPVDPDDPEKPTKTVNVGADTSVQVGDTLVYTIGYYNNLATAATVVVTDALDAGVTYVSCTGGGVYNAATHTVTWTIEDVAAFTSGSVTLTVTVNDSAMGETVDNTASVQIGNQTSQSTNTITNPVPDTTPKTGDDSQPVLWLTLMLVSAMGIVCLAADALLRRKRA